MRNRLAERLIESHEKEREAWATERRELLNRIQSPQLAAFQSAGEPTSEPKYVPHDDDQEWADYIEARAEGKVN